MRILSREDIENISIRVINAYKKLPTVNTDRLLRIEPELLLTDLLNLNVGYEHLSLDGTILGITSFDEIGIELYDQTDNPFMYMLDGKTVLVERDLSKDSSKIGRCNFSLMHEGAHQILKMLYPKDYGLPTDIRQTIKFYKTGTKKYPVNDWEEWQANSLASALLLPEELVEHAMYMFSLDNHIKIINKAINQKTYERFCDMASFLGVSKQALSIRMIQLGFADKIYLKQSDSILDILGE